MDDLVETGSAADSSESSSVRGEEQGDTSTGPPTRVSAPTLSFIVEGRAVPKGSKVIYRGRLVEASKHYPEWSRAVAMSGLVARSRDHIPLARGPVTVTLGFHFARPRKPKHTEHIVKPDLDKLIRGVLDPLTGILWYDDAQVNTIMATKHYDDQTFVLVVVRAGDG